MAIADNDYVYLYCITKNPPVLSTNDDVGSELYCVRNTNLYATVGKVPASEFKQEHLEQNLNNPKWLKRQVERHEQVIETIMLNSSVIPSKFATVFFNEQNVQTFLEQYEEKLLEKLSDLEGREEWGVKICCDEKILCRYIVENNPEVIDLDHEINAASQGKAYLLKRKRQQLVENITMNNINIYRKLFLEVFQSVCRVVRVNPFPPRNLPDQHNGMILNLAVLVDRAASENFFTSVETLKIEFLDKGFSFEYSGPWPPYNFSQITET